MTYGNRISELRKTLGLTLEKFGEPLGVTKTAISRIEKEERAMTDQMVKAICREYNVNEIWLRTGEGEPFKKLSSDEEIASCVSELLEDGTENPLYEIIIEIMKTYIELSPKSQEVIRDFSKKLMDNIREKGD